MLRKLGHLISFAGIDALCDEMSLGFEVLGETSPAAGRSALEAPRPADPLPLREFWALNAQAMREAASRPPDRHWEAMLAEILADRRARRMHGPFLAPPGGAFRPSGSHRRGSKPTLAQPPRKSPLIYSFPRPLLTSPGAEVAGAVAFGIEQRDAGGALLKVRRGEDWRRSWHNSTIQVTDKPHSDTVDEFAQGARAAHAAGARNLALWGHDHDGAYGQLPLRRPGAALCVVVTPWELMVWAHAVLLFGALGAVWAYGRVADFIVELARCFLAALSFHYVGDFGIIESASTAESSFTRFRELNTLLGFSVRKAKEQPHGFPFGHFVVIVVFYWGVLRYGKPTLVACVRSPRQRVRTAAPRGCAAILLC